MEVEVEVEVGVEIGVEVEVRLKLAGILGRGVMMTMGACRRTGCGRRWRRCRVGVSVGVGVGRMMM